MSVATTVPVTISPDAAAHVAALGLQNEFEQMLEHARQNIPELRRLAITLEGPYDCGEDPRVIINAFVPDRGPAPEPWDWAYHEWVISTLSPDVWRHILLMTIHEVEHER